MTKPMDIAGQTFIVTGAAKGIGLAISTLFHSLGARVSSTPARQGLSLIHISEPTRPY